MSKMDNEELMRLAEEAENKLNEQQDEGFMQQAEKNMLEMMGVSSFDEFMNLSPKEQKKRSREMNKKLLSMMGMTVADAMKIDRSNITEAKQNRKRPAKADVVKNRKQLLPFLKNVTYLEPIKPSEPLPPLSSKIGGKPDLPRNFEWFRNSSGTPLTCLLQLNLNDVPEHENDEFLPKNGMLYIFYDIENQPWDSDDNEKGFAVYYHNEDLNELHPTEFPEETDPDCAYAGFAEENCIIDEYRINFISKKDLPDYGDFTLLSENSGYIEDYESEKDAVLGYDSVEYSDSYFKLGGYSNCIQSSVSEEFGDDDIQLFQLCSLAGDYTDGRGFMFGDGGKLYFYIDRKDLAKCCFDKVKFVLQCY